MLYIVATPIGNLEDITLRALRILKEVDFIFCEDTRVTKKLLDHFEIEGKKLISYHQHTESKKLDSLIDIINNHSVALVSDAGTPGISDPGNFLIQELLSKYEDVSIESIPGVSAVTSILSISGFPTDKFIFKGFVPHKKGRQKFLYNVLEAKEAVVFYESCHRIFKTLEQLAELESKMGQTKKLVLGRELTKKFETVYRGSVETILYQLKNEFPNGKVKGELVLVLK